MNTILVVIFVLLPHQGDGYNRTVWKKDMKTQERCIAKAKELKAKRPHLEVYCDSKAGKGIKL